MPDNSNPVTIDYDTARNATIGAEMLKGALIPGYWLFKLSKSLAPAAQNLYQYLRDQGRMTQDDATNIATIIEAGKTQGVDEMDISVSKETLMGLRVNLKPPAGVDVTLPQIDTQFGVHGSGSYKIRVKYREPT